MDESLDIQDKVSTNIPETLEVSKSIEIKSPELFTTRDGLDEDVTINEDEEDEDSLEICYETADEVTVSSEQMDTLPRTNNLRELRMKTEEDSGAGEVVNLQNKRSLLRLMVIHTI